MALFASQKPVDESVAAHLAAEITEISAIYDRLYPDHALQLVLFEGRNPVWSAPSVFEGDFTVAPHTLSGEYIGTVRRDGAFPAAPRVTVTISIPRAPSPHELEHPEPEWRPNRRLAPVFGWSPLLYEQVRYWVEMRRKARSAQHQHLSLPRGFGSALLAPVTPAAQDKRPAILIGFHWLEVGGAEKLAFDSVTWALKQGLRVFVVASVPSAQRLRHKLPDSEDVTFLRLDRYLAHGLWPRFVQKLVETENVQLVHNHHCVPLYDALPQLRLHTPWVTVIDSTHVIEYADGGYPRISGVWSNFIDHHHVISRELVDYMRDKFGVVGKVHLGRMRDRQTQLAELPPPSLTPGKKTLHVSFIGRLSFQKRPVVVVESFRALSRWAEGKGVTLTGTLVGEGPFERAVEQLLNRYGLSDRIERVGATLDIPALLKRSDLLLLPSNNEGLALVCYEAIEHGCIPISTDVGSQAEIVPEDLLLPLPPRQAVRKTVEIVDRLWQDTGFLARQWAKLNEAHLRLAADPTAEEVISRLYAAALAGPDAAPAPESEG